MSIDPTESCAGQPLGVPQLDQAGDKLSARRFGVVSAVSPLAQHHGERGQGQIHLPGEAGAAAQSERESSSPDISQERLREILRRLTSGYYDNPRVQACVARRIHEEWHVGDERIE